MQQTVLITGSTDGIGLEGAKRLAAMGHHVLVHGRDPVKVHDAETAVRAEGGAGLVEGLVADLSRLANVVDLAEAVIARGGQLDVLVNNAGVFRTSDPITDDGFDVRFVVNTIAPYLLTRRLLRLIPPAGRIVNLSSAAQAPVDLEALCGRVHLTDAMAAYAQSKLAITMWSRYLADELGPNGPAVIALNPGSLLATKMVREGFGIDGSDIGIGADVIARMAVAGEYSDASGAYYDNDSRQFGDPHSDALDPEKAAAVVDRIEAIIADMASNG